MNCSEEALAYAIEKVINFAKVNQGDPIPDIASRLTWLEESVGLCGDTRDNYYLHLVDVFRFKEDEIASAIIGTILGLAMAEYETEIAEGVMNQEPFGGSE